MTRISPNDPRLTAYALGELRSEERAAVEAALRDDPAAQAAVEAIRALGADLSAALAHEPEPDRANSAAIATVESEADAALPEYHPRAPKVLQFPQLYFVIGGLAAAGIAVMVWLRDTPKPAPSYEGVHLTPVANGSMPAELPKVTDAEPSGDATQEDETPSAPTAPTLPPALPRSYAGDPPKPRAVLSLKSFSAGAPPAGATPYERDNPFVAAAQAPRSTFAASVDTASYANVRRIIDAGRLPPRDEVRIEEMLNYFPYDYAAPKAAGRDGAPIAASLEVAEAPWAPTHRLVRVGLKARDVAIANRPAANLVFLLDVSASMDAPNKLPLVKDAMRMLLGRLRLDDRVAIVTYAGSSGVALPSTPVAKMGAILEALDALSAGGSTNGAVGIQVAYDIAKANLVPGGINRVILCTDGDFNVGVTSEGELAQLVDAKAQSGVALTVLGFGMGQDRTLELLADKGRGNYGYIDTRREADKLLVQEVNGTLLNVATDLKVQVEFNRARVASYRLIGYEDGYGSAQSGNDDAVPAADLGAGDEVTALYEVVPATVDEPAKATAGTGLLTVRVRGKDVAGNATKQTEFAMADTGEKFADASADFKFAAAVAEFGMILRDSPHRGHATMGDVIAWASAGAGKPGDDPRGYRRAFIDLARRTEVLLQ